GAGTLLGRNAMPALPGIGGELLDQDLSQPLDVHRRAAREVPERLTEHRRAGGVRAAADRLPLGPKGGASANGAELRELERHGAVGTKRLDDLDDLRDHLAALFDEHRVPDADVLALDLVLVVERRARDGRPGERDGLEQRDRRQRAGPSDLDVDREELRRGLLRRVLEGDRPARGLRGRPSLVLEGQIIELDDDAVDLALELVALRLPLIAVGEGLLDRLAAPRNG